SYGDVDRMERGYRQHLMELARHEDKSLQLTFPYVPRAAKVTVAERRIDDGELHLVLALLSDRGGAAELALAQQHAPDSPSTAWLAALVAGRKNEAAADAALARAIALAPNDPFYRHVQLQVRFERELRRPAAQRQLAALAGDMHAAARQAHDTMALDLVAS